MDVCLVCLPCAALDTPMLSLSLLKSCLTQEGISSQVLYANFAFAQAIGEDHYNALLANSPYLMLGNAAFAQAAGGMQGAAREEYFAFVRSFYREQYLEPLAGEKLERERMERTLDATLEALHRAQRAAPSFLAQLVAGVVATGAKIVAIADMFQQSLAMLSFVRLLKEAKPELIVIVGGPSCMHDAGRALVDEVEAIDYTFSGEADECFGELCRKLLQGRGEDLPYGTMYKGDGGNVPYRLTRDLDKVPLPDYTDYVAALRQYSISLTSGILGQGYQLLVEGSRGCWWGEKHPCTFCGLNGVAHVYRQKSAQRLATELANLADSYGVKDFVFTDCILSQRHVRELPVVLSGEKELRLVAESKSNLTYEELVALKKAGFYALQPGIESLEDHFLRLMHKGNRASRHVELLRNMTELKMWCIWNLLGGFPLEEAAWYEELLAVMPLLSHLWPPNTFNRITYQRYSEYERRREKYDLNLRYARVYDLLWPDNKELRERTAYLFEPVAEEEFAAYYSYHKASPLLMAVYKDVLAWQIAFRRKRETLQVSDAKGVLSIVDLRSCAVHYWYEYTGAAREIYLYCYEVRRQEALQEHFSTLSQTELEEILQEFLRYKLMLCLGGEYVSLGTRVEG